MTENRTYFVKEIFKSIQGEGYWSGTTAVFCRFSGCNLWSGTEQSRVYAICKFCDTSFYGIDGINGGRYDADSLSRKISEVACFGDKDFKLLILTGGEPSLQVDRLLVDKLRSLGFFVAIETNGTRLLECGLDWVAVSPKRGSHQIVTKGDEIKVVFPQFDSMSVFEEMDFRWHFIQPLDDKNIKENRRLAADFCVKNPKWRLSLQFQKILQIR